MEKMDEISKLFISATSAVALAFTTGCSDPSADGSEALSTIEAPISQSSCATAVANQTFTGGGIDPSIVTPRTYNTCYKAYVVDIYNLNSMYTGTGTAADGRIEVSYADTAITDQATCEGTELRTIFYSCLGAAASSTATSTVGPGQCSVSDDQYTSGVWMSLLGGGYCTLGHTFSGVYAGGSFRVATTARTPSNETRKVRIGTYRPENIH